MSEARNQRFEIDIDEIERQLRRSVDMPAEPKADPLAELARIVGQNDPFKGILSGGGSAQPGIAPANANQQVPHPAAMEPVLHSPEASGQQGYVAPPPMSRAPQAPQAPHQAYAEAPAPQPTYDPVAQAYGVDGGAFAEEEFRPLRRRPSRLKLIAVVGALAATVSAVAIGLTWKKSGGFLSTGAPPVIVADKSPLKVAPENPGGVEVPNQDRQIYSREQKDGQSRVVDGREQPVDVRAVTPPAPPRVADAPAQRGPSVSDALGDPKRVRTVAVNPDGTSYGTVSPTTPMATNAETAIPAAGSLPAPVSVQTVAVPTRTGSTAPVAANAPAAAPPPAPVAEALPPATHQAVSVVPPRKPNIEAIIAGAVEAPVRTASVAPAAEKPAAKPKTPEAPKTAAVEKPAEKPAAGAKNYSVQIAVRPTEQEARTAWDQAQDKFGAALENKPARLTSAEVNGKTVHRVRLGPMTKSEADGMCARLKTKGGNCFVAVN
jgi:hypothetical protein